MPEPIADSIPDHPATMEPVPGGGDGSGFAIRDAVLGDLDALLRLDNASFETDRLSRRQLRYLLTRASARTLLAESAEGALLGYVTLLFSRGTSVARLYSIAVDRSARRVGIPVHYAAMAFDQLAEIGVSAAWQGRVF